MNALLSHRIKRTGVLFARSPRAVPEKTKECLKEASKETAQTMAIHDLISDQVTTWGRAAASIQGWGEAVVLPIVSPNTREITHRLRKYIMNET